MSRAPLLPGLRLVRIVARLLPTLAVAATLVIAAYVFAVPDALRRQALVVALFLIGFRLVSALVSEVLSPFRRNLRLIDMPDHRAKRLASIVRGVLWILFGTEVAIYLVRANGWNESVSALLALVRTCGLIVLGAMVVWRSATFQRLLPEQTGTFGEMVRWWIARLVFPILVVTALVVVVARSLGYVAVATWVLRNVLASLLIVSTAALLYRWLRRRVHVAAQLIRDEHRESGTEPSPAFIGVERLTTGALRAAGVILTLLALLNTWEIDLASLQRNADQRLFGGFGPRVGPLLTGLGAAIVVVIAGWFLRTVLIFFVFPRADVERGARYATLTILRYVVIVVAALFVLKAVGLDTSALAVFAGAFGVGLAFGLQDIFANFFSGLIMLVERPVRVGDAVQVGGTSGHIEAIRLRGTTIRTFDKNTVTIPNRQLISERVTNLSRDREQARITLLVGAGYESDPTHVKKVLRQVVENDGRVQNPLVLLDGFGESSLDFSLRCYTDHVSDRGAIGSDLRSAVLMAFRREGIDIPAPQRDVRVTYSESGGPTNDAHPAD